MSASTHIKANPARFQFLLEQMSDAEMVAFEDKAYTAWMQRVDAAFEKKLGVTSRDLPDHGYRDLFDSGESPEEAVQSWIEDYGEEFGLDPDEEDY